MLPGDRDEIRSLFEIVFHHPMSNTLWDWKYGSGRGSAVVARHGANIVAHYGGIQRNILNAGRPQLSMQCVDTMVDPHERGTLSRHGPYFLVARAFLDRHVGHGRRCELAFGFPNNRVMRLGEKVGIQAEVDEIVEPAWDYSGASSCTSRHLNLSHPSDAAEMDKQWLKMASCFKDSIIGCRDSSYMAYRYAMNPTYEYDILLVTTSPPEEPLGVLVLRPEGPKMLLLDIVGHTEDFPALIQHARSLLANRDCDELTTWVTESHLSCLDHQTLRVDRPDVRIPTCVCTDGPKPEDLRGRWWLTAGDAEFK